MKPKLKTGFTLIELLVVVAIIALLVAILVPTISHARMQAKMTRVRAQLQGISVALESFAQELGDFPPSDPFGNDPRIDPCYVPTGAHILAAALVGLPDGSLPFGNKKAFMTVDSANALPDTTATESLNAFPVQSGLGGQGMYVLRDVEFGSPILYYRANRRARYSADPAMYSSVELDPRSDAPPAVYYISDNALITGAPEQFNGVSQVPTGWIRSPIFADCTRNQSVYAFADYVEVPDTRPPAPDNTPLLARAQNSEEFLLISAGNDGRFGPTQEGPEMCDDIGNFNVPTAGPPLP